MKYRSVIAISAMSLLTLPARAWAQAADVTFVVPVNLTQLSPDLTEVYVRCEVESGAIAGYTVNGTTYVGGRTNQLVKLPPPVGGRVSATATVRVPIVRLDVSAGNTATYRCALEGRKTGDPTLRGLHGQPTDSTFRLSPTPPSLRGSFSWVEAPTATVTPVSVTTTSPGGQP